MEKKYPFNLEAEQAVLGAVFLDGKIMTNLKDSLVVEDFYDERNRIIYKTMQKIHDENSELDYMTVYTKIDNDGELRKAGGKQYIIGLVEASPSAVNVSAYVDIVLSASLKRRVIDTAKAIADVGMNGKMDSSEYIDLAEEQIFALSQRRKTTEFSKIHDVASMVRENTEKNRDNQGEITGLVTGFFDLDKATLGLQKEELMILAARPSMGKSALAMNIAVNVAKKNNSSKAKVAVFSLEMGATQLVSRMISSETNIDSYKIRSGRLSPKEWQYFEAGIGSLGKLNMYFNESGDVTIADIRAKCRKQSQSEGLDLIVIDYLQLIGSDKRRGNRQEEVSSISRSLKQLARELHVPVLALSQLSREVERREDKRPIMADLRESGSIEQDADIVMFLYCDDYYNKEKSLKPGIAELIISKNRQGISGNAIELIFERNISKFKNKLESESNI